ncbi:antitoxin [Alcaligenes faecalis]|nr:antitoxin [Alcaligenes faecalis]
MTDCFISVSEFEKNLAYVLLMAGEKPFVVLNHNLPVFYMGTPRLCEALVEEMANRVLDELVRQWLAVKDTAVEVGLEQL